MRLPPLPTAWFATVALAAAARGRGQLDWSAVALSASEEAGVDVSHLVPPQKGSK